jgi:putative polyketide hydroxylase
MDISSAPRCGNVAENRGARTVPASLACSCRSRAARGVDELLGRVGYENPDTPSGSAGSRLPLLQPAADPRDYGLTLLTASPDWARVADAVGVDVRVRLVPDAGSGSGSAEAGWAEAGWAETAGVGAQGAVLVRPDRFVAWRSQQAPGAESLEHALRTVFDR